MPRKVPPMPKATLRVDSLREHRLLTEKDVAELTGLTRRQRLKLEKRRAFPMPIRVTKKILLYPSGRVLEWIEQRSAAV